MTFLKGSTKRIVYFASLFPKLENLTINNIRLHDPDDSQVPVIERPPPLTGRLKLISILIRHQEGIIDLASMQGGVKFCTVDPRSCPGVQVLMDGCARTTERLILDGCTRPDGVGGV